MEYWHLVRELVFNLYKLTLKNKLFCLLRQQPTGITFRGKEIAQVIVLLDLVILIMSYDDKGKIKEGQTRSSVKSTKGNVMLNNILPVKCSRPTNLTAGGRDLVKFYINSMQGSLPWHWDHLRGWGIIFEWSNQSIWSDKFNLFQSIFMENCRCLLVSTEKCMANTLVDVPLLVKLLVSELQSRKEFVNLEKPS